MRALWQRWKARDKSYPAHLESPRTDAPISRRCRKSAVLGHNPPLGARCAALGLLLCAMGGVSLMHAQ